MRYKSEKRNIVEEEREKEREITERKKGRNIMEKKEGNFNEKEGKDEVERKKETEKEGKGDREKCKCFWPVVVRARGSQRSHGEPSPPGGHRERRS